MNKNPKWYVIMAIAAILAALACSCGSPEAIPPERSEELRELGNAMVSDLQRDILPYRENPEYLAEKGYILDHGGRVWGIDDLAKFFVSYQSGTDCGATIIFANKSFVVARIVFVGGNGYYMRYEYEPSKSDSISVSGQIIDKVELKYQESPPLWELTLTRGKKDISFKLRNPV